MKLRRISLAGFKTFARRSEVVLQPGLTAVVGPNGSGKSNLVDAIRWALGETSARELRGHRMDEVIYAGGQGRGRSGYAEVELLFDNDDGQGGGTGSDEPEIAVARRVNRHGDSEFRLNGDRVRLRDLERALSATGLTQTGYAVVAQNDIDGIIQASPAQRRVLVEQAAGVRALHAASDDALRRVGAVEERLVRLDDLLTEAEPHLAELEEQAAAALEMRAVTERLAELRGSLAREQWRAARARLRVARNRSQAAGARAALAAEAQTVFLARLTAARAELDRLREGQRVAAEAVEQSRLGVERAEGEQRHWIDRQRGTLLQRSIAAAEVRASRLERQAALREVAQAVAALAAAEDALAAGEVAVATVRRAGAEVAQRAQAAEQSRDATTAERAGAARAHALAESADREARGRLALVEEAVAALRAEVDASRRRAAELSRQAAAAAQRAGVASRGRGQAQQRELALRESWNRLRTGAGEARRGHADEEQSAFSAAARAAALRGQVEGALGEGGVAAAVAVRRLSGSRLVDGFRVREAADQAALEAALERWLGAWLVEDLESAVALLQPSARETLLAGGLDAMVRTPAPRDCRAASSAIEAQPWAAAALERCLAGIWLAPDRATAQEALRSAGGWAVLPDGTVLGQGWVRGGGRPGETLALAEAERTVTREAERARAAAAESAEDIRRIEAELDAADRATQHAAGASAAARRVEAEAEATAAAAVTAARAEERRAASLEAALQSRHEDRERLVTVLQRAASTLSTTGAALGAAERAQAAAEQRVTALRAGAATAQEEAREHEVRLSGWRGAAAEAVRTHVAAVAAAERLEHRGHASADRLLTAELDLILAVAGALHARGSAAASTAALQLAMAAAAAGSLPAREQEELLAQFELDRADLAVASARASDEFSAAEVELQAAAGAAAALAEAMRDEVDDDSAELDPAGAERVDREIVRLERRVAAAGPVNALAPEQCERLRARVNLWRGQRGDLGDACRDLRTIAADLGVEIDRRFEAVFGAVSYHFHELFQELFPGGRATLRLEPPEAPAADQDPAQSGRRARSQQPGVEILAQPPGKRLQPLTLLSGGERALTALATILALQQVNPSPFYLFDEVDAPLDDTNVVRFVRLLQRLSEQQQFLVVTHNHATMAAADGLYGVSIDGEGVSSVIGVRFRGDRLEPLRSRPVAQAV